MTQHTNTTGLVGTLTFTGSLTDLAQLLNAATSSGLTSAVALAAAPSEPSAKATSASSAKKSTAATTEEAPASGNASAQPADASAPAASGQASATDAPGADVTYEQVSAATLKLVGAKGKPAAIALFAQFGVANAKGLTEAQWADYLAAAEAALA